MSLTKPIRERIQSLKQEYDRLKVGKESLLQMIDDAELPESVYNSNAIENSTLTLQETEKILLELEVSRDVSVREVFEAKNLARVISYLRSNIQDIEPSTQWTLFLHTMLMTGINDSIAGRFRTTGEYVRVGTHIAPAPEHVKKMIESIITGYSSNYDEYLLNKIARFHVDFEIIHPFIDGNGRIGRIIMNAQLLKAGFPLVIIRDKEKKDYYQAFTEFHSCHTTKGMEKILSLALQESLHKRITYLQGDTMSALATYVKRHTLSAPALLNAARRQTIPAFREKGVWTISDNFEYQTKNKKAIMAIAFR